MNTNEVKITLTVDDQGTVKIQQFGQSAKQGAGATDSWTSALKSHWVAITAATAAVSLAVNQVISYVKSIANLADQIQLNSTILGVSTTRYQEMAYAARLSGVANEEFGLSMKMLARSIEEAIRQEGQARQIFALMGITIDDLKNKRLDQVFLDVAEATSKWEDGGRKVDYMMALMGRSAERMIGQMNKGKDGLNALGKEAHETGKIIDEDTVKKGAEAKEAFERMAASADAFKLSLGGLALVIATILEGLTKLIQKGNDFGKTWGGDSGALDPYSAAHYAKYAGATSSAMFGIEEGGGKPKTGTKPGELPDTKMGDLLQKQAEETAKAWGDAGQIELDALEKMQLDIVEAQKKANAEEKSLTDDGLASMLAAIDAEEEARDRQYTALADLQRQANAGEEQLLELGLQATLATIDAETEARDRQYTALADLQRKKNEAQAREQQKSREYWENFAGDFGESAMSKFFNSMHTGFKDLGDMAKSIGMDVIAMLEKMIMNALIFGNVMGQAGGTGGGFAGLFGGFLNSIFSPGPKGAPVQYGYNAAGGIFNSPTLGVIGEAGPEAVIPLKNGRVPVEGGGQIIINNYDYSTKIQNLNALNTQSFEDSYGPAVNNINAKANRLTTRGRRQ